MPRVSLNLRLCGALLHKTTTLPLEPQHTPSFPQAQQYAPSSKHEAKTCLRIHDIGELVSRARLEAQGGPSHRRLFSTRSIVSLFPPPCPLPSCNQVHIEGDLGSREEMRVSKSGSQDSVNVDSLTHSLEERGACLPPLLPPPPASGTLTSRVHHEITVSIM